MKVSLKKVITGLIVAWLLYIVYRIIWYKFLLSVLGVKLHSVSYWPYSSSMTVRLIIVYSVFFMALYGAYRLVRKLIRRVKPGMNKPIKEMDSKE